MSKKLSFTSEQLYLLLDAMEGYDIGYQSNGNEDEIETFEKLYNRILKAYQTEINQTSYVLHPTSLHQSQLPRNYRWVRVTQGGNLHAARVSAVWLFGWVLHQHTMLQSVEGIMNQQQFDKLYTTVYDAYEQSALKDEYIRSTLGDVLDHMILLKEHKLITPN